MQYRAGARSLLFNTLDHKQAAAMVLAAVAVLTVPDFAAAQLDAPGEPVTIPGAVFSTWSVKEVRGRFGRTAGATGKVPAVLILHGSGGVDGRGAFHATALQEAGIATLEITMFPPRGRPRAGHGATMPHAAAALKWLAARPDIHAERLGVMGFSWGGVMTVLIASELVQEQLDQDVPRPVAFAPLYPVCTNMARFLPRPEHPFYGAYKRMSAAPMLIHVGTRDDYETVERPCDALVAMWPAAARERTTVRNLEDATHGFDSQTGPRQFFDEFAYGGRGGTVHVIPSPKHAAEAREAIVRFFLTNLKP
jgi:dienelactone hydrolase